MAGFAIHIAIAQEYLRKHNMEYSIEFINGTIAPDLTTDKSKTHYGKSPAYTNLKNYLKCNIIESMYDKGFFLHLVTDYLFYNYYLDEIDKQTLHNDYDCTNRYVIEKYNVVIPNKIKEKIFYLDDKKAKILNEALIDRIIEEISKYNLEDIAKEIFEGNEKWNFYKRLI